MGKYPSLPWAVLSPSRSVAIPREYHQAGRLVTVFETLGLLISFFFFNSSRHSLIQKSEDTWSHPLITGAATTWSQTQQGQAWSCWYMGMSALQKCKNVDNQRQTCNWQLATGHRNIAREMAGGVDSWSVVFDLRRGHLQVIAPRENYAPLNKYDKTWSYENKQLP